MKRLYFKVRLVSISGAPARVINALSGADLTNRIPISYEPALRRGGRVRVSLWDYPPRIDRRRSRIKSTPAVLRVVL